MTIPDTYLYRVGYRCPRCGEPHITDSVVQSFDSDLESHPLIDLYHGDTSRPEIAQRLGTKRRCVKDQRTEVIPTLEDFFLVTAR